jgi:FAD/FMN-containing dehydrogenase
MSDVSILTLDGSSQNVDGEALDALAAQIRGHLVTSDSADYDDVRSIWNAMIDRRPAVIARCQSSADVMACVRFAREHGLLTCVRGGGHHIAGNSIADDAFMIDLSMMKSVHVDTESRRVTVAPGATLGDVDAETAAFGLVVPTGINSTTGIAGYTLGGGFGWMTRKYGMTVDSLVGADVVTADGERVRASADTNPDLFWAIRGGGGNFGIVTSFEFDAKQVGPEVIAGLIVYSAEDAGDLLRQWRAALPATPEELSVWPVLRQAPPLPFLPEEVHGTNVVILAFVHNGDAATAMDDVAPFRAFATPVGEHLGPMPFAAFQQAFDPLLEPGARNYWKSHDFSELSDEFLDAVADAAGKVPSPECEVFIAQLGGAMGRVGVEETAYPGREANFVMNVHGRWREAADDDTVIGWARALFDAAAPHALGTAYINFMTEEESTRLETAYGRNWERLLDIKAKYDPDNFFRVNLNLTRS